MNKITWQHLAGAAIGTSAGAGAGLGIGTFMIGQALTAPISLALFRCQEERLLASLETALGSALVAETISTQSRAER